MLRKLSLSMLAVSLLVSMSRADDSIPIYVFINMHTEQTEKYHENESLFWSSRTGVVEFATMLYTNGVMFNFQSDWTFLDAVTNFDVTADPATGGTNVVAWMYDELGFEIDPHNHYLQSDFNMADVAYLIERCGVEPSGIVGGYTVAPPEDSHWNMFQSPVTGGIYTTHTWQATALNGAATAGHAGESIYWYSGIWKSKDATNYSVHSDAALLPVVGRYGLNNDKWGKLDELLAYRDAGLLCTGRMYTCSVATHIRDLTNAAFTADFEADLQVRLGVTNVHWVGIQQALDSWSSEYGSKPNLFPRVMGGDRDGDGMNDGWEITNFCGMADSDGTGDWDGDYMTDGDEYISQTSPTNEQDYFQLVNVKVVPLTGNRTAVTWLTSPGLEYRLDAAPSVDGAWTNLTETVAAGPFMVYTSNLSFPQQFFRVRTGD